jgi:Xaa-Pro aminopeptidase
MLSEGGMKRRLFSLCICLLLLSQFNLFAQDTPHVLPLREREVVINEILEERLDLLIPGLMREAGIDMWIVMAREYNEDPVIETMLPARYFAARRLTILLFFDRGGKEGIERISVSRYDVGVFKKAWDPETQPDQWQRLAELIAERNPEKIALNYSEHYGHADGITEYLHSTLLSYLSEELTGRIVSGEELAVGWLEKRTPRELIIYRHIVSIAHQIIAEGLSEEVITPGITTTRDLQWWYRERIAELKLQTWFHPSVSIQRADSPEKDLISQIKSSDDVIMPGDIVHIDLGITYLRLNTDTQQNAYVLKQGETDAPAGLKEGLRIGNRLQDILTDNFKVGRTGNEILKLTREQAEAEGIVPSIYSHPLGFHGHAAGTTIGMWDNQGVVPGDGDRPMRANTAYAIELNATVPIPEWGGKKIRIMLEEDACFDGEVVYYINGRQTDFHLIPRQQ